MRSARMGIQAGPRISFGFGLIGIIVYMVGLLLFAVAVGVYYVVMAVVLLVLFLIKAVVTHRGSTNTASTYRWRP